MPLGLSLGLQSATEDAVLPRIKWHLLLQPRGTDQWGNTYVQVNICNPSAVTTTTKQCQTNNCKSPSETDLEPLYKGSHICSQIHSQMRAVSVRTLPDIYICLVFQQEEGTLAVLSLDCHVQECLSTWHGVIDGGPRSQQLSCYGVHAWTVQAH